MISCEVCNSTATLVLIVLLFGTCISVISLSVAEIAAMLEWRKLSRIGYHFKQIYDNFSSHVLGLLSELFSKSVYIWFPSDGRHIQLFGSFVDNIILITLKYWAIQIIRNVFKEGTAVNSIVL